MSTGLWQRLGELMTRAVIVNSVFEMPQSMTTATELERAMAQAIAAFNAGRLDIAAGICNTLLQQDSGNAPAHQLLAVVYLGQRQSAAAYHHICASLQQRPDHAPSLKIAQQVARANLEFGLALQHAGQWEPARDALERSLHLEPQQADAWFTLGLVQQDLRAWPQAAKAFGQALALRPDYAEAAVNLGIVLQDSGALDDAINAYRTAYRLRPDTFGRIAHALTASNCGRMWLDLAELRQLLAAA